MNCNANANFSIPNKPSFIKICWELTEEIADIESYVVTPDTHNVEIYILIMRSWLSSASSAPKKSLLCKDKLIESSIFHHDLYDCIGRLAY